MNRNRTSFENFAKCPRVQPGLIFVLYFALTIFNVIQAGPDNIAHQAKATASSSINHEYSPAEAIDGIIHISYQGQMGGVSALMSLGIFSLRGTASLDPVYEITSPVFC